MYRCILAPVDGTAFGEAALPYAAALAHRCGATLQLAHVHEPIIIPSGAEGVVMRGSWTDVTRDEEEEYLQALAEKLSRAYDVRVRTLLLEGDVAEALERCALDCAAGLIVMSTRAHTGISRLWHHGVAEQLARELPLPVLLIRADDEEAEADLSSRPEIRHILVPVDGTAFAEGMLEHAVALGRVFGARYTLVRVVRPESTLGAAFLGQDGHGPTHQTAQEQTAAQQYLSALAERMRAGGLEVATRVLISSDVAGAILQAVAAGSPAGAVDLLAVEGHPHGAVSRLLAPHTTDALLRNSPVPMLVFQPATATTPIPNPQPILSV